MAILWYHDQEQAEASLTSGQLTRIMADHHVGTPNSTQLSKAIRATKLAKESTKGFSLKPGSRRIVRGWLPQELDGIQPDMNHAEGYVPESVWINTRGCIESVAKQLNGCFQAAYYDAALVMLRRLLETLIIEAYEHLGKQSEIQNTDGTYHMLAGLVDRATGQRNDPGLNIGRNTKTALGAVKKLGDRSAHDRRFQACTADLTKIQIDVRTGVQDLIQIAALQRAKPGS
ncbi:MAG: DUF4145 domain-containing protein [Planctomycetota bacterium]|nr:DUF4145 domain-containing protein [Planctomycetota bacterium]